MPWQAETGEVQRVTYTRRFFGDVLLETALIVVTLGFGWFIWLFFTAETSQTPAKRLLNVYILDAATGQPTSAGRVWVRELLVKTLLFNLILSGLTLYIAPFVNFGWVLFDQDRQALHDKIVRTIVVYAPNGLPASMASRQAKTSNQPVRRATARHLTESSRDVREDALRQFAREAGGEFIEGEEGMNWEEGKRTRVVLEVDRWRLTLNCFASQGGDTTYMSAYRPNGVSFKFDLRRRDLISSVAWALGREGRIKIGDFEFDREFRIKADDESKVRTLFADTILRERIEAQESIELNSTPPDRLHFMSSGDVEEVARLRRDSAVGALQPALL